jgi:hypothetical protein
MCEIQRNSVAFSPQAKYTDRAAAYKDNEFALPLISVF